ncbi:hypothetical protein KKJ09_22175, partial [Xenorhabdus bovienii]|nr:hypothetical protein [Xenorhabdus bovienii]MDE9504585.1 hypothetical protein [Xenorhabdus bovienii]MDE9528332.1 hypothetical protein [Xenorhabdus bovienii]
ALYTLTVLLVLLICTHTEKEVHMEKVNDIQKITRQADNSKREPTDATNSIDDARSEAFRKALLHTQTKYADIIKALEDK